ncbi:MAG: tetratricopeptide repeat protein [Thalassotalea sp.]
MKFSFKIPLLLLLTLAGLYYLNQQTTNENAKTHAIINSLQVNDILFMDARKMNKALRPYEKYHLAKVIDITGNYITLKYSSFYYSNQKSMLNAIRYGQLTYKDYFEGKRHNLSLSTLKKWQQSTIIYGAKRPNRGVLLGHPVNHNQPSYNENSFILGKKENTKAQAYLANVFSESEQDKAFQLLKKSAQLGYAKGQVNLALLYFVGTDIEKDLTMALYWLEQAALQSWEPAIHKYKIICELAEQCNLYDFYMRLQSAGVNIKVRKAAFDFKIN